jgi:hypothetical protein
MTGNDPCLEISSFGRAEYTCYVKMFSITRYEFTSFKYLNFTLELTAIGIFCYYQVDKWAREEC